MAEVISQDGAWSFDGEVVRIVPGRGRNVHRLRKALGELAVPLQAVAGIAYAPGGRKGGRLRLRDGADPFSQAVAGMIFDAADPYQLSVDDDRTGVAEFFVDDLRNSLLVWEVPSTPCDHYLLPGPSVPLTATAGDGTATFDGERVRLEWNWLASQSKSSAGPQEFELDDLAAVEWNRQSGMGYGHLRFRRKHGSISLPPEKDPSCLAWGIQRDGGTTALLAAAVVARLPHPWATQAPPPAAVDAPADAKAIAPAAAPGTGGPAKGDDHDALLRRLRELGDLHREGVLTDEEFAATKRLCSAASDLLPLPRPRF